MVRYKSSKGEKLEGELFKPGMEDGICEEHKRPFIETEGKIIYPSKNDYVFTMDGETRKRMLMKELFESNTTLIN
jgi:hypothetical protein